MDYEIVLLDVFDTAIHRNVAKPTDVFMLAQARMEKEWRYLPYAGQLSGFPKERAACERLGRRTINKELTLDEIYELLHVRTGLPLSILAELKQLEIEIEIEISYADPETLALFFEALNQGNEICFLSDMYLPGAVIRQILEKCGYMGRFDVRVSCEERKSKHTGEVYKQFAGKKALMVGDNQHSDIKMAEQNGISARLFCSKEKIDNWLAEFLGMGIDTDDISASLAFGTARRMAIERGDTSAGGFGFEDYGRYIFGPFVFGYLMYIRNILAQQKPDVTILFARDMYLFDRLLDLEHKYAFLNRLTLIYPAFQDVNERFDQFPDADRLAYREYHKSAAQSRDITKKYIDSLVGDARKIAIVDIGWVGNIQNSFSRLAQEYDGEHEIFGVYAKMSDALPFDPNQRIFSWLDGHKNEGWLWKGGVELLEFALVAPYGTTLSIEERAGEWFPVLEESDADELEYRNKAAELQKGILDFIAFAQTSISPEGFNSDYLCGTAWADPFFRLVSDPSPAEASLFGALTHSHDADGKSGRKAMFEFWKFDTR